MYVVISKRARVLMILVANRVVDNFLYLLISVNFYRYKMMLDCWQDNPENRPTFTQIRENLEAIMQKDNPYLDLTAVDESRAEYNAQSFNSIPEQSDDEESDNNVEIVVHEGMQHRFIGTDFMYLLLIYCISPFFQGQLETERRPLLKKIHSPLICQWISTPIREQRSLIVQRTINILKPPYAV